MIKQAPISSGGYSDRVWFVTESLTGACIPESSVLHFKCFHRAGPHTIARNTILDLTSVKDQLLDNQDTHVNDGLVIASSAVALLRHAWIDQLGVGFRNAIDRAEARQGLDLVGDAAHEVQVGIPFALSVFLVQVCVRWSRIRFSKRATTVNCHAPWNVYRLRR